MVRLTVTLVASRTDAPHLLDAFRSLTRPIRLEPGYLRCFVWKDDEDDTTLRYVEEWATECDMRRRVQSDRFTLLLAIMEAASLPPHIQFDFVTIKRGLDYVEDARRQASDA